MARRPVRGRSRVARFFAKVIPKYLAEFPAAYAGELEVSAGEVNGDQAVLAWSGSTLIAVLIPEVGDGRITAFRAVANPDKLGFAAGQLAGLSRSGRLPVTG
jgi:RNA polymerase sigma-70 factor (ECF subfamily)